MERSVFTAMIDTNLVKTTTHQKPNPIQSGSSVALLSAIQAYLDFLDDNPNGDELSNYENAIFEAAMIEKCGPNIFSWINEKTLRL